MSNACKLHKHYQYHFQSHVFLVNKEQHSKAIASFFFKNVLKFPPSLSIHVFISIKTTSPYRNSGTQLFCMLCWDFWCMHAPRWRNMDLMIMFSEIKACQFIFHQGNMNFQAVPFEIIVTESFRVQYFVPLKTMFGAW